MTWAKIVAGIVGLIKPLLYFLAYLAGRKSVIKEQELDTLKKEKEYLEIELTPRDDSQRMKDGTW